MSSSVNLIDRFIVFAYAAYNMVRKVFGEVFSSDSIVGYAASPVKVHPLQSRKVIK